MILSGDRPTDFSCNFDLKVIRWDPGICKCIYERRDSLRRRSHGLLSNYDVTRGLDFIVVVSE